MAIRWLHKVHYNYGTHEKGGRRKPTHLVRLPNGRGKILFTEELETFLRGKLWRKME